MMGDKGDSRSLADLLEEIERLRIRLDEAEQALEAIRAGEVDALVVEGPGGEQLYSLAGAERVYRVIVESMQEAALTVGEDGTILFCNERFCELTKTPMERALGRPLADFAGPAQREPLHAFLATGRVHPTEERLSLRAADGTSVPVLLAASPLESEAGPSVCVVAADLTQLEDSRRSLRVVREREEALRESEEQHRALVELSPDGVFVSQDGRFAYANPACLALFGADRTEDLLLREVIDFVHAEDRELVRERRRRIEEHGWAPRHEVRMLRLDGREVLTESAGVRIAFRGAPAIQVTIRDVSEQRRLEQRLAQAQRMEAIGQLAAGIAHDFNNMLVGVIGNASLAQDMIPPGSAITTLLERIVHSGEEAALLTRQLLAYAGKGRVLMEPLDLSDVVRNGADLIQGSLPSRVRLSLGLGAGLPRVSGDRSQLHQVFMNLVINAAEAIGSASGTISVQTGVVEGTGLHAEDGAEVGPGRHVSLEVSDDGCGMDVATRRKIFDPFFSTKFLGRGLGLAAVSGIVRSHGGAIQLESAPGQGSRFRVLLPAVEEQKEAEAAAPADHEPAGWRGTGTVLLVDDEEIVLETGRLALERHGYEVLLAPSGPAALRLFERESARVDLVVLDLSMPGMGGEEVLPALRRIRRGVRVLMSSGFSREKAMQPLKHLPGVGFIQKPYTAARLASEVRRALAEPRVPENAG